MFDFDINELSEPIQTNYPGGMLDPSIDIEGDPFSYFWHPTDVIGAYYNPVAFEITPEGYIYSGFGELMFFIGNLPQPVNKRVKTLYKGYLPIIRYNICKDDVNYEFESFAADLGGSMKNIPVAFENINISNNGKEIRTVFISSAFRFSPPVNTVGNREYRFEQRFELLPDEYTKGQKVFNPNWKYDITNDALIRDDRIIYIFSRDTEPFLKSLSISDSGLRAIKFHTGEIKEDKNPLFSLDPHTPMGFVMHRIRLEPGESKNLYFKMPIVPIPQGGIESQLLRNADYDFYFKETVDFWENMVGKKMKLKIPEEKVQNFIKSNIIFNLLCIDKINNDYIMNVNKFQYHYYFPGNSSTIAISLDLLGFHDIAEKTLLFGMKAQTDEGRFIPVCSDMYIPFTNEGWGYVMWAFGWHYRLTKNMEFLKKVYPSIQKAMIWLEEAFKKDPLGLFPIKGYADDAYIKNAHQTGENIWGLIGLKNVLLLAEEIGNKKDYKKYYKIYTEFRKRFDLKLNEQVKKTGGYIPPALEKTREGNNWDNLLMIYPEALFDPLDPRVTETIMKTRKSYVEGLLPFIAPVALSIKQGRYEFDATKRIHYWQSQNNAENLIVRGLTKEQKHVVKDLYALLLHTTSTNIQQEWGSIPWGDRDYIPGNILPDGAASAKTMELIRNMLVREYNNSLYLFSAVTPYWMIPGKKIELIDAPTFFGDITAILHVYENLYTIDISHDFHTDPEEFIISIPWFFDVDKVESVGCKLDIDKKKIYISPETKRVKVIGKTAEGTEILSYVNAVKKYKEEYNKRYQIFLKEGKYIDP